MEAADVEITSPQNQRLKNFLASLFLLVSTWLFYSLIPYYQVYASIELVFFSWQFVTRDALQLIYIAYGLLLLFY